MGYIKEPKGVDIIIQSRPLTDEDRKVISEFIRKSKAGKKLKQQRKVVAGENTKGVKKEKA